MEDNKETVGLTKKKEIGGREISHETGMRSKAGMRRKDLP